MNDHQKVILKVAAGWMLLLFLFPPSNGKIDSSPLPGYRQVAIESATKYNLYPFIVQQLLTIEENKLRLKRNAVDWGRLQWEYRVVALVAFVLIVASYRGPHDDEDDNRGDERPPIAPDPHDHAMHMDAKQVGV